VGGRPQCHVKVFATHSSRRENRGLEASAFKINNCFGRKRKKKKQEEAFELSYWHYYFHLSTT